MMTRCSCSGEVIWTGRCNKCAKMYSRKDDPVVIALNKVRRLLRSVECVDVYQGAKILHRLIQIVRELER